MKKALVVLLAVAMIFCFAATAMAATYTDMADQTEAAQDAVAFNSALGIIGGYPDGTYGPEKNITRAEFAKIAVNAVGLADSADYLVNTASKFSDVKVGAWYTGFVNLAQSQGYLQGYPDGTFRPNATITNQEVVTVLLRMLGYSDNLTGPWPVDYINQAVKLDLLDDVNFVGAIPATRADVAVMAKANLDQDLMDWDKDKDAFVAKTPVVTLLADSFGATSVASNRVVDGIAGAAVLTVGNAFTFDADDAEMTLNTSVKDYVINADTAISDGMTFDQLAGHVVTLVLNDAGKKTENVAYIDVTSYTKSFDEVTDVTGVAAGTATKIGLDDKNYNLEAGYTTTNFPVAAAAATNLTFTAFFNEDDEVYAVIDDAAAKTVAAAPVVVKEEATSKGKVTVFSGTSITVADDADAMIIKDGKQIKVADLKKYDVVAKYGDLYLVSALQTGKLSRMYGTAAAPTALTLADTKYKTALAFAVDKDDDSVATALNDYLGEDVQYVINANNQVIAVVTGVQASTTVKGIVVDFAKTDGTYSAGALDTITVFTADGTTVKYDVDGNYELNAVAGGLITNGYVDADGDDNPEVTIGSYVEFKLDEDGVIKSAVDYSADAEAGTVTVATTPNGYSAGPPVVPGNALAAPSVYGTSNNIISDNEDYITLAAGKFAIKDGMTVFNITKNTDNEIEVELLDYADVVSGSTFDTTAEWFSLATATNNIVTAPLFAIVDGLDADVLVACNANGTTGTKYGFLSADYFINADGDEAVTFVGDDKEYVVAAASTVALANLDKKNFVTYTISGDEATITAFTPSATVTGYSARKVGSISGVLVNVVTNVAVPVAVEQIEITDDTVIYSVDDDGIATAIEASELSKDDVIMYAATDGDADYILVIE